MSPTYFNQQAKGSSAQIIIGEEATFGAIAVAGYILPVVSTSLALSIESFRSERIRADRMTDAVTPGNFAIDGDIACELQAHGLTTLLKHALGDKTYSVDTPAASVNQHYLFGAADLNPTNIGGGGNSPSLTVEVQLTDAGWYFRYTGARVNRFVTEFPTTGPVTTTFTMAAVDSDAQPLSFDASPTDIVGDTGNNNEGTQPFTSFEATINLPDSGTAPIAIAKSGRIDVDNAIGTDNFVVGQQQRANLLPGRRVVQGNVELLFLDTLYYNQWKNSDFSSLLVKFQKVGTGANERSCAIAVPTMRMIGDESATPQIADEGPISITVPFTGLRDASATTDVAYTIVGLETDL